MGVGVKSVGGEWSYIGIVRKTRKQKNPKNKSREHGAKLTQPNHVVKDVFS